MGTVEEGEDDGGQGQHDDGAPRAGDDRRHEDGDDGDRGQPEAAGRAVERVHASFA